MKWPLLERVPDEDRRRSLAIARRRRFVKDEVVFQAGDVGYTTLHLVVSGRFCVRVTTPLGETAMLSLLGPGDFFGVLALLDADAESILGVVEGPRRNYAVVEAGGGLARLQL